MGGHSASILVMIIFGTRGVTTTPESGQFYCPGCGGEASFRWKRVRRFFTLYFIPIIPLNKLGEYIECKECKGTYDPKVLEFDPGSKILRMEAQYETAVRHVMIAMLLADGHVDDTEVAAVRKLFEELTKKPLEEKPLRDEIAEFSRSGATIDSVLSGFDGLLNDHGKEKVVEAAYLVAAADGVFDDSEMEMLAVIGKKLGLSVSHLRGLMATLSSGERVQESENEGAAAPPLPGA